MNLQEHFTRITEPKIRNKKLIGWFSYGGNNRVKHFYLINTKQHYPVSACGDGYMNTLTDKAKKRLNKNPHARIHKKCKTCQKKISKWKPEDYILN